MKPQCHCLIAALLLVAAGCVLYGERGAILPRIALWLDVGERPTKADYVYVLGGDVNVRPLVAAAIYRAGLAKKVLVSHVDFEPGEDTGILGPQHQRICKVLKIRGVPAVDIILIGNRHRTTHDEAATLAAWLPNLSTNRVIVVTNDFHTRRARWIFGQVFQERAGAISFVSAPVDGFRADDWWQNQQGFTTIVGENVKLFGSFIFYRPAACALGIVCCGVCFAVFGVFRRRRRLQNASNSAVQPETNTASISDCAAQGE